MVDINERQMPPDMAEEEAKPKPATLEENGKTTAAVKKNVPTTPKTTPSEAAAKDKADRKARLERAAERDRGFAVKSTDPETSLTIKRLRSNGTLFRSLLLIALTGILLYPLPIAVLPVKLLLLLIVAYLTMQNLQLAGYQRDVKAIGKGAYVAAFTAFTFHVVAFIYILARVSMIILTLQSIVIQ